MLCFKGFRIYFLMMIPYESKHVAVRSVLLTELCLTVVLKVCFGASINLLATDFFFQILAHPVFKM